MSFRIVRFALFGVLLPTLAWTDPDLRSATAAHRARAGRAFPEGIAIIQSADRSQSNLLEFMQPDTENHDFVYLTGLDRVSPPGSTLILNPRGATYREVLYTLDDPERVRQATGIAHVFPQNRLLDDLSNALTDYRNLRITQLRFKPVGSDLSRGLGTDGTAKVVYLNYPRFTNLAEPDQPRLTLAERLRAASPEVVLRDAGEIMDRLRMIKDEYEIEQIRKAVAITAAGLQEGMRQARPGVSTGQVGQTIDFIYRLNDADPSFETSVQSGRVDRPPVYATAREEQEAHGGSRLIVAGGLVHVDTGAEFQHYAADVQRTSPASGRFTPEQRAFYEKILAIQKAVIGRVRPGARWQELHELAVGMLRDAGGWDQSYTYGIGHFLGMDVHDHGDYLAPLEPGMVLAIEQGATVDGVRVALEDSVLVTPNGNEWLSRAIPIEPEEIEAHLAEPPLIDLKRLMSAGK